MLDLDIEEIIPILRIFDEVKAREFYLAFLGFKVDWEHRFEPDTPIYMQISRGKIVLHLSEHSGDCSPGATVIIGIKNIEEYYQELSQKDYKYNRPGIEIAPWHAKVMEVIDPFSNRLRFNQDIPEENPQF